MRRDPDTGLTVRQDGNYSESTSDGSGRGLVKIKVIPPADMAELAKNGIAPYEIPNWDKDDPNSNWYLQYRKFNPEKRAIFLSKLEQHGRIGLAARWAGVVTETVNRHRKEDAEFDAACNEAVAYYHEMCAASITHQGRMGQVTEKYDKDGRLVMKSVQYEQQLRILMLKRAAPEYNDVQKQEMTVVGGAVVVPAPIDSVESWDDVVRRHTGGGSSAGAGGSSAGALTAGGDRTTADGGPLSAGGSGPGTSTGSQSVGGNAVSEGRVVKRIVLETNGTEVGKEGTKESND